MSVSSHVCPERVNGSKGGCRKKDFQRRLCPVTRNRGGNMNRHVRTVIAVLLCIMTACILSAQETSKDKVKYVPKYRDPVLEEMKEKNKTAKEERDAETQRIRDAQEEESEKKEKEAKRIRFDFSGIEKPKSPDAFKQAFHFQPVRQFLTGTCWCFSTTSYFESEVHRLTGMKIKLSEMYTVYYEFLEEGRRYVRERGESFFEEGSEGNAVMMIWRKYGIVPFEVYTGELDPDGRYDHSEMTEEMQAYLEHIKENDLWDEELVLSSLGLIMNKYMGKPPDRFTYEGKEMTPQQFLTDVLKLNLNDYVCVISTLSKPFYEYAEYEVEANWWHSDEYFNVPLEQFYETIKYAAREGYTVRLNGDVSEPGYNGFEDAAIIPTFDIPYEYIDQHSREFRFNNETTSDDHDIHLVGHKKVGNYDWYLIKDSASSAQHGQFKGYWFYREDYIKLKMLTIIVHKDAIEAVVKEFYVKEG
jgi:bleomycin hydrolase